MLKREIYVASYDFTINPLRSELIFLFFFGSWSFLIIGEPLSIVNQPALPSIICEDGELEEMALREIKELLDPGTDAYRAVNALAKKISDSATRGMLDFLHFSIKFLFFFKKIRC